MIRLHTGVPGTGKSLAVVDAIEHDADYKLRQVYAHAVDGWERATVLACKHPGCRSCRSLTPEQRAAMLHVEDWQQWAEAGALIVIDEAHYAFPSRREVAAPTYVVRLTEHRHDGIDFWLCTPNANMLDINVRRLVEEHVHFLKGLTGRFKITHNEVMANDEALRFGDRKRFMLPTRSYKFYKSADAHVKLKRSIPAKVYYLGFCLLAVAVAGWRFFSGVEEMRPVEELAQIPAADQEQLRVGSVFSSSRETPQLSRADFWQQPELLDFEPRLPQFPESAPAFDLAPAPSVVAPRLAGCVVKESNGACTCYTDQATVYKLSREACRANVYRPEYQRFVYGSL